MVNSRTIIHTMMAVSTVERGDTLAENAHNHKQRDHNHTINNSNIDSLINHHGTSNNSRYLRIKGMKRQHGLQH